VSIFRRHGLGYVDVGHEISDFGAHFDAPLKYPGDYLKLSQSTSKNSFLITPWKITLPYGPLRARNTSGFANEQHEGVAYSADLLQQAQPIRQNKRNG